MQRERGKKKKDKNKKSKVRAVGEIGGTEAGVGRGWAGRRARVDRSGKIGRIESVRSPIQNWVRLPIRNRQGYQLKIGKVTR